LSKVLLWKDIQSPHPGCSSDPRGHHTFPGQGRCLSRPSAPCYHCRGKHIL